MKKPKKVIAVIGWAFAAMLCCALFFFTGEKQPLLNNDEHVQKLTGITYETENEGGEIVLPIVLKGIPAQTTVALYTQIPPGWDSLLIKSVFTRTKLYLNGELVYEFGQYGSYPSFMNDPPTGLAVIPLPKRSENISLRLEYLSPSQRNEISLPAIYAGSEGALIAMLFRGNGFSLLFSLVLIIISIAMGIISIISVGKMTGGTSFLWLGLFSLAAGVWVLGECDLSAFLIPYPSLLYAMAYIGLFCTTIPFLRFGLVMLKPKNRLPILVMLYTHRIALAAALLLQLSGASDLMKTLYLFHFIAPLAFTIFAADLLWEYYRHANESAKRFAPAVILLAAAVVLELVNYWFKMTGTPTVIFQLGVLCFIAALGVESGRYMRDAMKAAAEKLRLEYEVDAAKERERLLASENASLDRMNRLKTEMMETISHEARTPLAVLSSYAGLVSMELKDNGVSEQTAADLDKIVFEAKHVANLIDSMKKLTLHGGESAKRVSLDISALAYQTAELYRHILKRGGLTLTLTRDEAIGPVLGNAEELTQVLFNLLQNAKNHTEQGGVTINVNNNGSGVTVSVTDTGTGISPELLPHVFKRGVSGGDGSGIGLALCKDIIEAHGGTITIESKKNNGTIATFTLPEYKDGDGDGDGE